MVFFNNGNNAFESVDGADEIRDETIVRKLVYFFWRPNLLELALIHDRDPARKRHRLFLIVCHYNKGDAKLILEIH